MSSSVFSQFAEVMKQVFDYDNRTIEQTKQDFIAMNQAAELNPGFSLEKVMIADYLPAEWVRAANVPRGQKQAILHFHGGGFVYPHCNSFRNLASLHSEAAGVQVLSLDYRTAPEHKYPAANDDCLAAYRWLLENGFSPENIVICGESCGGTLVLMTLLSLRDAGDPMPAAGLILSWFDPITFDGESYISRAELDPFFDLKSFQIPAGCYFDASVAKLPPSPLSQNLAGLPSLFIQIGDYDVVLSDSIRLAERATAAGVDVTLEVWDGMPHAHHGFAAIEGMAEAVPEARQALDHIGKFVRKHLG